MKNATGLSKWFFTSLGRYVASIEQDYFDREVADVFGFNAFQIGLPEHDFLRANRMPFRCVAASHGEASLLADARALPIRSGVADLVLLPHALEFSENPHQVLREVQRVLMPEGHIILSGFNPWSLWGVRGAYARLFSGRMGCYVPPVANEKWRRRFDFMEKAGDRWWPFAGGIYFLHGIKRVQGMRLITPKWKSAAARERLAVLPQRRTRTEESLAARRGDEHPGAR